MSYPKASVLVLTLNAGDGFGTLLEGLRAQRTDFEYEVVVVDSGSTDSTVELARSFGATVHRIPQEEFGHGATRNLGISLSRGEYVALLVQDAIPLNGRWLAAMVEDLDRDGRVAGVYGRQVPRPEADALTRVLVNGGVTASSERREQFAGGPEEYARLPAARRRELAAFDNVSSCLRRSVWEAHPFESTGFGEDLRWGKRVVEAGHKLVYEPRSAVIHSHERGFLYDLRRHYVEGLLLRELFGLEPAPNLPATMLAVLRSAGYLYLRMRREEKAPRGAIALLALAHAATARSGAYLATKVRGLAGASPKTARSLHRFLSKGI